MNDFEHSNAIFSGLTDFRDQAVARFLDGRHIRIDHFLNSPA